MPIGKNGVWGRGSLSYFAAKIDRFEGVFLTGESKNTLLVQYFDKDLTLCAFDISNSLPNDRVAIPLWEYTEPPLLPEKKSWWQKYLFRRTATQLSEQSYWRKKAFSLADGSHLLLLEDYSVKSRRQQRDRFVIMRLAFNGKEIWQYTFDHIFSETLNPGKNYRNAFSPQGMFMNPDQKTITYGLIYSNQKGHYDGSFLLCVGEKGKEIHRQSFKDQYWEAMVRWPAGSESIGFSFIEDYYDTKTQLSSIRISIFDQNLHFIGNQILILPNNGFKEVENQIHAAVEARMVIC